MQQARNYSRTGLRNAGLFRQRAFTLIEVMMVIVVIGVMAGIVAPRIGGNQEREFRRDATRLQQVISLAAEEAQYAGAELGWQLAEDGQSYGFFAFDDSHLDWQPYDKSGFKVYKLDSQYHVQLELLGKPVELAELYRKVYKLDEKVHQYGDKPVVPALLFFSAGEYTPFRLWLSSDRDRKQVYVIEGDGLGSIRLHKVDANRQPRGRHG